MSRSSDLSMFRRGASVVMLAGALAAALSLLPAPAHAADAATDSNCATKPASVPDGYTCTPIYEPNGSSNGTYGEVWFLRDANNVLRVAAFTTLKADPGVLLCARTTPAYAPSNNNQADKCIGKTPSLIYNGSLSTLEANGQSLESVGPLSQTVYWVLHITQGGKTTVALATSAGLVAKPTVSFDDSCSTGAIVVTLANTAGTAPAHFTLSYGSDHLVDVPAGASTTQSVTVPEDTTGSVTVSAQGLPNSPVTQTWARNCSSDTQTLAAAPTAALDHSCDLNGILVTLGNAAGTAPADFTVHYAGTDHAQQLASGATLALTVPVTEDTTETVTVTASGMTAAIDTWARNCSTTVPPAQHAINPAVSFGTGCTTGITATLSNMQLDDTTTDAVTFSITTPTGAVEQVVVGANQITKRSYDFADGTTGTVAVQAPGLAKQTKTYAKSCTAVLGEKVTKGTKVTKVTKTPTTAVEGSKAAQLPMTGSSTGAWLRAALLLLVAGCALSLAGRRPYRPRHAR